MSNNSIFVTSQIKTIFINQHIVQNIQFLNISHDCQTKAFFFCQQNLNRHSKIKLIEVKKNLFYLCVLAIALQSVTYTNQHFG